MYGMGEMPVMGMRMPGQSLPGAASSFAGMWLVMTAAMMLPSLVPMLRRHRQAAKRLGEVSGARLTWLTAAMAGGYFVVWMVIGAFVFPAGVVLSAAITREPALAPIAPLVDAGVVLIAGLVQLTRWKARRVACASGRALGAHASACGVGEAWGHGLRLGLACVLACGNLMAICLVLGMMDLRVMTLVTAAITAERLEPRRPRVAQRIGVAVVGLGLVLMVRATV